jgi:cytochrome c553
MLFSPHRLKRALSLCLAAFSFAGLAIVAEGASQTVNYDRDIRPIFSDTCFKCHGPDASKRKAKLRLDTKSGAYQEHDGHAAITPGDLSKSEAWRRMNAAGTDDLMPPKDSGLKLSDQQIRLLGQWIKEGAHYAEHWSFVPPVEAPLPTVRNAAWPRNAIDNFILERLESENLLPSPEADKATLIRRVTLDLTGLPPTPAEVSAFIADKNPGAYEKVVERLLNSPHYGERMALDWLDAARFADTHGYHIDSGRDMTHWREWVIDSFNANKPFDRFTVEQIAGDLLPNATTDQKIASGFNRNHMINFEGGAIPEEYHTAYLIDRVNTTSTVWLGLTIGCAQCHDHKFDPITQKDYYRLFAFFNNVPEKGLDGNKGNAEPVLSLPDAAQSATLRKLSDQIATAESKLKEVENSMSAEQTKWEAQLPTAANSEPAGLLLRFALNGTLDGQNAEGAKIEGIFQNTNPPVWTTHSVEKGLELNGQDKSFVLTRSQINFERTNAFSYGGWVKQNNSGAGAILSKMDDANAKRGFDLFVADGKVFFHLIHSWPDHALRVATKSKLPKEEWTHVFATYDGSGKASGVNIYLDGKDSSVETLDDSLNDTVRNDAPFNLGKRSDSSPLNGSLADVRVYGRALEPKEVAALAESPSLKLAQIPQGDRTESQRDELKKYFRDHHYPAFADAKKAIEKARKAKADFEEKIPTTMVMSELDKPRDTFVLMRGQYDKLGEKVTAGVPAALPPLPEGAPANRLGLAEWLVSPRHPLTARVIVNRYWQMYFGTGLVKTAEDFGSQGEWPSHPELLDWLAAEFIKSGWDIKHIQKLIVTSATYCQSSKTTPELEQKDPENRLLARGPRFRLQAEFVRDQALAISGLLNDQIGGKSVSPYQPPGLWEELMSREDGKNWTAQTYTQSHGPDLYRRTMYTFWKRTSPPPTLSTFDAPDRETCTVRRQRTNTPLQALVLMNDPTYIEASRKLAERLMREAKSDRSRLTLAYRLAMSRAPKDAEIKVLLNLYNAQLTAYRADTATAKKLMAVGESKTDDKLDSAELAAWTVVTSTILNLDETVTKG